VKKEKKRRNKTTEEKEEKSILREGTSASVEWRKGREGECLEARPMKGVSFGWEGLTGIGARKRKSLG